MVCFGDHDHHNRTQEDFEDLEGTENDPTLQDCCRRELKQQRQSQKLLAQLSAVDRSQQRTRKVAAVLADAPQHDPFDCRDPDCSESGCCGAEEAVLRRLREARLRELRGRALREREAAAVQYGTLHQLSPADALALIELAKLSVCLMTGGGSRMEGEADIILQDMARQQTDRLFVKAVYSGGSPLAQHCCMPGPGLVCLREGRPVAAGPLDAFLIQGRVNAVAVAAWITQAATAPFANLPPGPPKASPVGSEGSDGDEWAEPCTLCGRAYPHEHVQPAIPAVLPSESHRTAQITEDDEDSDFD